MTLNLRSPRSLGVGDVFAAEQDPENELLTIYDDSEDHIEVRSHSTTIVLNRDIMKSVEISSAMSVFLAKKFPERRVLLVNSYASTGLMQRSLARALWETGFKLPPSFKQYLGSLAAGDDSDFLPRVVSGDPARVVSGDPAGPMDRVVSGDPAGHACEQDALAEVGGHHASESGDSNAVDVPFFPQNLRVLDCPTGTLTAQRLDEEVSSFGAHVVILNSLEFTAITDWHRRLLAHGLLDVRARHGLSLVIFSHEQRSDIASYRGARGAIGILSAYADSVWRIMTPFERIRWERRYQLGEYAARANTRLHAAEERRIREENRATMREIKAAWNDDVDGFTSRAAIKEEEEEEEEAAKGITRSGASQMTKKETTSTRELRTASEPTIARDIIRNEARALSERQNDTLPNVGVLLQHGALPYIIEENETDILYMTEDGVVSYNRNSPDHPPIASSENMLARSSLHENKTQFSPPDRKHKRAFI